MLEEKKPSVSATADKNADADESTVKDEIKETADVADTSVQPETADLKPSAVLSNNFALRTDQYIKKLIETKVLVAAIFVPFLRLHFTSLHFTSLQGLLQQSNYNVVCLSFSGQECSYWTRVD